MPLQGFDQQYYLAAKLAALQSQLPEWRDKDSQFLEEVLNNVYQLSAEEHYRQFGYLEGLAPNGYFDAGQYSLAKAERLHASGAFADVGSALAAFQAAWPQDPYQHYLQFGGMESLNPSNSFDASSYLAAKLAALQQNNPGQFGQWSTDDLLSAFAAAGLTPLGHYLASGQAEGLSAPPVPANEQVNPDGIPPPPAPAPAPPPLADGPITLVGDAHDTFPYSAVVYLEATFPNGLTYTGSGAIVGVNDVLTAAHLVYSAADGGEATAITVYPGFDGGVMPYGAYAAETISYFEVDANQDGLMDKNESQWDVAVVGFAEALAPNGQWFGLDPGQTTGIYRMSGYGEAFSDPVAGARMSTDTGWISEDPNYAVFTLESIEVSAGHSGSPVYYSGSDGPMVVGVISTAGWAVDVYAQYHTILAWISGNDHSLAAGQPARAGQAGSWPGESAEPGMAIELTGQSGGETVELLAA